MNIFVLHADPRRAAQMHCDKHVVKMIMETAQLLSTARTLAGNPAPVPSLVGFLTAAAGVRPAGEPLRPTHANHPCAVWVRECDGNYGWARLLGVALCDEYTYRYGRVHAYDPLLRDVLGTLPRKIKLQRRKPFVYCGPPQYRTACPIASYRAYYCGDKARFARWTRRAAPSWFVPLNQETE